ncbi:MAG TPA: PGF-CTERM sorting domain-containing protein, partial [Methanothrix sp.]|nr:PGF-CTERM sorting domain-containing protein [Methanothrix sp.]
TEAVAEPAATNETPAKTTEEAAKPAENKTEPSPGFESVFAITGLLAVAYLVLGRRE